LARIGNMTPSMRKRSEGKAVDIKPIRTTRDDRRALKEIEGLMHAKRNTPAGDRLDVFGGALPNAARLSNRLRRRRSA
jgi:hypothetical protein